MAYATVTDVQARIDYTMTNAQQTLCSTLLGDAADIIDTYNADAPLNLKKIVSCRMVIRSMSNPDDASLASAPVGATQGSMSALGYSQSWTIGGSGTVGELYLSKVDKRLLGIGNVIGSHSPTEDLVCEVWS